MTEIGHLPTLTTSYCLQSGYSGEVSLFKNYYYFLSHVHCTFLITILIRPGWSYVQFFPLAIKGDTV